jgi:hypothetical protein
MTSSADDPRNILKEVRGVTEITIDKLVKSLYEGKSVFVVSLHVADPI